MEAPRQEACFAFLEHFGSRQFAFFVCSHLQLLSQEATEVKVDCWGGAREASKEDKQGERRTRKEMFTFTHSPDCPSRTMHYRCFWTIWICHCDKNGRKCRKAHSQTLRLKTWRNADENLKNSSRESYLSIYHQLKCNEIQINLAIPPSSQQRKVFF